MTSIVPIDPIGTGVINLDLDAAMKDPILRNIAGCMRSLRPIVDGYCTTYGSETTMAALVVIVANQAIDHGDAGFVAEAFRQNAIMLEKEAELVSLRRRA